MTKRQPAFVSDKAMTEENRLDRELSDQFNKLLALDLQHLQHVFVQYLPQLINLCTLRVSDFEDQIPPTLSLVRDLFTHEGAKRYLKNYIDDVLHDQSGKGSYETDDFDFFQLRVTLWFQLKQARKKAHFPSPENKQKPLIDYAPSWVKYLIPFLCFLNSESTLVLFDEYNEGKAVEACYGSVSSGTQYFIEDLEEESNSYLPDGTRLDQLSFFHPESGQQLEDSELHNVEDFRLTLPTGADVSLSGSRREAVVVRLQQRSAALCLNRCLEESGTKGQNLLSFQKALQQHKPLFKKTRTGKHFIEKIYNRIATFFSRVRRFGPMRAIRGECPDSGKHSVRLFKSAYVSNQIRKSSEAQLQ